MIIAYVTTYDAKDIENWSGLGYHIAKALEDENNDIIYIGGLKTKCPKFISIKEKIYRRVFGLKYLYDREPCVLRNYARQINNLLKTMEVDIVFSPGTIPIAYLDCEIPIVFWTDAVFAGMVDFYPEFSNLCNESIKNGNAMEKAALSNCTYALYSSEWAAKKAIDYYNVRSDKVRVVPFGANIECKRDNASIRQIVDSRSCDICKLLFIGVDWERKGGRFAVEVAMKLNQLGLKTMLSIVGCRPDVEGELSDYIKIYGYIKKNSKKSQLDNLLAESHFLILPTKMDCTPVVFSEANSFGVPCLSSNTGGINSIIKDGINGKVFLKNAKVEDYCYYIIEQFGHYSNYKKMAIRSFFEYKERLNWTASGNIVKKILDSVINE